MTMALVEVVVSGVLAVAVAVAVVREVEGVEVWQSRTKNLGTWPKSRRVGLPKRQMGMVVGVVFAPTVQPHVPKGNSEAAPPAPPHVDSAVEARDFVLRLRLRLRGRGRGEMSEQNR